MFFSSEYSFEFNAFKLDSWMLDVGTFKEIHSICLNISNTSLLFNTQNMTYKNATLKKCNKKSSIESVKRNVECKMDRYFLWLRFEYM